MIKDLLKACHQSKLELLGFTIVSHSQCIVLCKRPNDEYVVHMFANGGFHNGNYTRDLTTAWDMFYKRHVVDTSTAWDMFYKRHFVNTSDTKTDAVTALRLDSPEFRNSEIAKKNQKSWEM